MYTHVILDNGHGVNTPGKCSPDKIIREYAYTRRLTAAIAERLRKENVKCTILVPEDTDVSLGERVRRANKIYEAEKKAGNKAIFISVHLNAAGNGSWMSARGWAVFISGNASANSKKLANCLSDASGTAGLKVRRPLPSQKYWVQNFYVCKYTNCPAVLTENLFQDNKEDVKYLLSDEGFKTIVDIHIAGIKNYLK